MKKIPYTIIIIAIITVSFVWYTNSLSNQNSKNSAQTNSIETINYKILGPNGENVVLFNTEKDKVDFVLQITPKINTERSALYTLFCNGKQINCSWNGQISNCYRSIIVPGEPIKIKIEISNLPKGVNTMQFGTVFNPDKLTSKDLLMNDEYILALHPFTIVFDANKAEIQSGNFINKGKYFVSDYAKQDLLDTSGLISSGPENLIIKQEYNTSDDQIIYYLWKNSDELKRKVRFSLLLNWEQINWSPNEMHIDVLADPGDVYIIPIKVGELPLSKNDVDQLAVIAFLDPDKSFWYFDDTTNDWEADHFGGQAFSTQRILLNTLK